jgi:hypothetical protein
MPDWRPNVPEVIAEVHGQDLICRQSQTRVRFPDHGWKAASAHRHA